MAVLVLVRRLLLFTLVLSLKVVRVLLSPVRVVLTLVMLLPVPVRCVTARWVVPVLL